MIIDILRGRRPTRDALVALERAGGPAYCSAVSFAEIFAGLRRGEEAATDAFFAVRPEIAVDARVGRRAGGYLARYARSHGLEIADALIAAAASTSGLRLWTVNRRHYPMADVVFYEPGPPS